MTTTVTPASDLNWQAVLARNARFDGVLFYGVRSTGVFCRPSCPSRRPRREQVDFFFSPEAAQQAGFRPCRRCRPQQAPGEGDDVRLAREVCRYIEENGDSSLSLTELAAHVRLSPAHLQRTFKAVTGISPREYVEARRLKAFKTELRLNQSDVTEALYYAGYGSSSRIYEKAASRLGMTPGRYRNGAAGVRIRYTVTSCWLGKVLMAATERGICAIKIGDEVEKLERELRWEFPKADIARGDRALGGLAAALVEGIEQPERMRHLPLDIQATAFQQRVYKELARIPAGQTRSYTEIARRLGQPTAHRAVARACATNPVALVIPCHRVVRSDGNLAGYRWGIGRKRQLLEAESGQRKRAAARG